MTGAQDSDMDQLNDTIIDGVAENPDGTVTFSPEAYARWKPRLARLGINIDNVRTVEDWTTFWRLDLEARAADDWIAAELVSLMCFDPVECARLRAQAARLESKATRHHLKVVKLNSAYNRLQDGAVRTILSRQKTP